MPARATDQKPKILYVEDNRENRMLVRAVLEAAGYAIVEAEDGLGGIETAVREQPALVLLDINLPGVDGYEIVAILKSFPNLAATPVIAVTAYAMQGDRQRTLVAGCDGYIQKPINVDAFPRQVAEFLAGKRERVESREEGVYLRELNQRLVYRLLNQVEELKRLNQHFVRRAGQLADLHRAGSRRPSAPPASAWSSASRRVSAWWWRARPARSRRACSRVRASSPPTT